MTEPIQEVKNVIAAARDLVSIVRDRAHKHITEVNLIAAVDALAQYYVDKTERLPEVMIGPVFNGSSVERPAEKFRMEPVQSSNVRAVGYSEQTRTLVVEFASGGFYRYEDVSPHKYASLRAAPSIGSHLATNIKGVHKFARVEATPV